MKISEVLRKAADNYLTPGPGVLEGGSDYDLNGRFVYSCDAITHGVFDIRDANWSEKKTRVLDFLRTLGLSPDSTQMFSEFEVNHHEKKVIKRATEESQGARYAWLHFAADRAEEEGL